MTAAILEIHQLSKRYPGVLALDGVSLSMAPGRIHALVGENGAGKSTLIKILAGLIPADGGAVALKGVPLRLTGPVQAARLGIAVVHQHSHLIPQLSVAENHALRAGYPRALGRRIDWRALREKTRAAVRDFLPNLEVKRSAGSLSAVEKQLVELSFAFSSAPEILILDEPTAVLPHQETEQLFARLRIFAAGGGSALFISHRLDEVFALARDVTVLRDGKLVWRKEIAGTGHDDLIRAMVGRAVEFKRQEGGALAEEIQLEARGLDDPQEAFRGLSFQVRRGEIYGLYGLVGAGQAELCQALFGLRPVRAGEAALAGQSLSGRSPLERAGAGLGYVPSDRLAQGLLYKMTVGENLSVTSLSKQALWRAIDREFEKDRSERNIRGLQIRTTGREQGVAELSGGNQQKVLLGRWLEAGPRVLILEDPTQGVDVGAKGEIHRLIKELARKGLSILLVTSEIPELLALSHRVGVLREGELVGELEGERATEEEILRLALPQARHEKAPAVEISRARSSGPFKKMLRFLSARRELSIAASILCLIIAFGLKVEGFATASNLLDVLTNNAILLVGAVGMMGIIISGGIDISAGAILGIAAVAAGLADQAGWPAPLIALGALLAGLFLGALNGAISILGKVHPVVVTLGTLAIIRAMIPQLTGSKWIFNLSENVTCFGQTRLAGLPVIVVVSLLVTLAMHGFLANYPLGRRLFALGGHRANARALGISAARVVPFAFGLGGLLFGLAGLLLAGRFGNVQTTAGIGFELKAIAAAVIGGTAIQGGRGSALGTFLGTVFTGLITNVLVLARVSEYWEGVVVGTMILLALAFDRLISRAEEGA